MAGALQIVFAALHALSKTNDGSVLIPVQLTLVSTLLPLYVESMAARHIKEKSSTILQLTMQSGCY